MPVPAVKVWFVYTILSYNTPLIPDQVFPTRVKGPLPSWEQCYTKNKPFHQAKMLWVSNCVSHTEYKLRYKNLPIDDDS